MSPIMTAGPGIEQRTRTQRTQFFRMEIKVKIEKTSRKVKKEYKRTRKESRFKTEEMAGENYAHLWRYIAHIKPATCTQHKRKKQ